MFSPGSILLGSLSPRRRELLSLIVPAERIVVSPPADAAEAGFENLHDRESILQRITSIASDKLHQVARQHAGDPWSLLITADTVVLATAPDGSPVVLGKPDGPDWKETTRHWFQTYYSDRSHEVVTAVCLQRADGTSRQLLERTTLRFRHVPGDLLDWYIETGEPLGKAGGYGFQGAGSLFVESVQGSTSNVIGLPLEPVWRTLREWDLLD